MTDRQRARQAVEAVWRIESAKVVASLTRVVGDVGLAEDLAQDALIAALEQWPSQGVPDRPAAWLVGTAKHRAIDGLRRRAVQERKYAVIARDLEDEQARTGDLAAGLEDQIGDDLLSLVFMTCHPLLTTDARVALTLRLFGGLTTGEVARAFLAAEPTIAQRISRAKRTLADAQVPFEVPAGDELLERLPAVLGVLYLVFNEGYTATAGKDWIRGDLCHEAMRLGRILAGLLPRQPEVHALCGLMELQASRLGARTGAGGAPVLLAEQDRRRWDRLLIRRGLAALERAERLGGAGGPYALQAGIAACHARAARAEETDWKRIVALYGALVELTRSPVVELNRAVAVAMAFGPEAGLAVLEPLHEERSLRDYHHLPSVRAELLSRLGRDAEAEAEYRAAAALAQNARERALLLERAAAMAIALGHRPAGA